MSRVAVAPYIAVMLLGTLAVSGAARAQSAPGFEWSRKLAPGTVLAIRNGDGPIRVSASTTDRVEVRAEESRTSRASRGSRGAVTFDVDEASGRVTICTLYRRGSSCRDRNRSTNGNMPSVQYTLLVPRDVRLDLATGSGEITVERAGASATAATGSGRVFVSTTSGPVSVATGSGDVEVRVQSASPNADVDVTTGTGSIVVAVPADFGGDIDALSGDGTLRTDFEITVFGRLEPQHLRGTIGRGSSRLHLVTGSGRIELRKY